jgi:hypothetical protein
MPRSIQLLVFPLVSLALSSTVGSQEPPSPPVSTTVPAAGAPVSTSVPSFAPRPLPPPSNQNVRIDVTISLKGDAKPLVKSLTMVAGDGKETKGRAGIEIPVPTQMFGGQQGTAPITSYNYKNVSVNVDATPQLLDQTHVWLRLNLQFTTVYKSESGQGTPPPSFGQGSHEVRGIVFESGKPVVVTQSADGETGREYTVEVKATILK